MRLFVTAADRTHQKSLLQLLGCLAEHQPGAKVLCYDMGIDSNYRRQADELAEVRTWHFSPDWTWVRRRGRFHAGAYGWKPRMIALAMVSHAPRELAWLDAGIFVFSPLDEAFSVANRIGLYSPLSRGRIGDWCHPGLLPHLQIGIRSRLLDAPCRSAGAVFMNLASVEVRELLFDWLFLSQDPALIAPLGCSVSSHRYDQTLLGILVESRGFNLGAFDHCLGFCMHCDLD